MSRKSAANFSLGSKTPQYHHYTVPKSRSENFVDYMKSIGYELPKHLTPSHLDYLFQPSETELFDCVKFLMGRVKQNVREEDMARFQSIVDEGRGLTEEELVSATAEEEETRLRQANAKAQVKERVDELRLQISETRSRINQWHHAKSLQGHSLHLDKLEKSNEQYQSEHSKRKVQCQEQELQDQRVRMDKEMSSTLDILSRRTLNPAQEPGIHPKTKNKLGRIELVELKGEEQLMTLLRTTAEQYGTGLVGKSEEFDPFEVENFARECGDNVKDVERLRVVLLHEFETNIRITAKLQTNSGLISSWTNLLETAKRIVSQSPEIREKIINEYQKRTLLLTGKVKELKHKKFMELREHKLAELNSQIQVVQNMKTMAKKREKQFFTVVSKMLLNQRARLEIGMHLMKRRAKAISEVKASMVRCRRHLCLWREFQDSENPEAFKRKLSFVDPKLLAALKENGIPPSMLSSYESCWKALVQLGRNEEIACIRNCISDGEKTGTKLRRIKEAIGVSTKTWESLKSTLDKADDDGTPITTLSTNNQIIKAELAAYPENRERLIQEAIDWKRSKCGDINAFLQTLPTFL